MSAVQWVDNDLPLTYTFAFETNSKVSIVQQLSLNSYATTVQAPRVASRPRSSAS